MTHNLEYIALAVLAIVVLVGLWRLIERRQQISALGALGGLLLIGGLTINKLAMDSYILYLIGEPNSMQGGGHLGFAGLSQWTYEAPIYLGLALIAVSMVMTAAGRLLGRKFDRQMLATHEASAEQRAASAANPAPSEQGIWPRGGFHAQPETVVVDGRRFSGHPWM